MTLEEVCSHEVLAACDQRAELVAVLVQTSPSLLSLRAERVTPLTLWALVPGG